MAERGNPEFLAAAGLHALEHNVERLREDRARAERLAQVLSAYGDVQQATNMIFFTACGRGNAAAFVSHMSKQGIRLSGAMGTTRLVLHKDVAEDGLAAAIRAFQSGLG